MSPKMMWFSLIVLAVSTTTAMAAVLTANNTCKTPEGETLEAGTEKMYAEDRTCTILRCLPGGWNILEVECVAPPCVNPRRKSDACCYSCPSGHNCHLPGTGQVINSTLSYKNDTHICTCPSIKGLGWDQNLLTAQCQKLTPTPQALTTTVSTQACFLPPTKGSSEQDRLRPGESKLRRADKGCHTYLCDDRGVLISSYQQCQTPACNKPVLHPGHCCSTCTKDTMENLYLSDAGAFQHFISYFCNILSQFVKTLADPFQRPTVRNVTEIEGQGQSHSARGNEGNDRWAFHWFWSPIRAGVPKDGTGKVETSKQTTDSDLGVQPTGHADGHRTSKAPGAVNQELPDKVTGNSPSVHAHEKTGCKSKEGNGKTYTRIFSKWGH